MRGVEGRRKKVLKKRRFIGEQYNREEWDEGRYRDRKKVVSSFYTCSIVAY